MNPHDVERILDTTIVCSCGQRFTASTLDKARADQIYHRGLALSRAALPDPGEGA